MSPFPREMHQVRRRCQLKAKEQTCVRKYRYPVSVVLRNVEHWCPSTNTWCVDALIRQKCQDAGGNANTRRRAETGLHSGPSSVDFFKISIMPLPHPCLAQQSVRVLGILDPGSGFRDPGSGVWAQGTGIPDPISSSQFRCTCTTCTCSQTV